LDAGTRRRADGGVKMSSPLPDRAEGARDVYAAVMACLDTIVDPCSSATVEPMSLVAMGLIRGVRISSSGEVDVDLRLTSPSCFMVAHMSRAAVTGISAIPGVSAVRVHADEGLDWTPEFIHPETAQRRRHGLRLLHAPLRSERR
jgi:metal-sulfur cluster biosynthetic enzyme